MNNKLIEQEVRMVEMVFPEHTNHYGTLFGGRALSLMDKAAFIAATRYCRKTVVTVSSEPINFHKPVKQGQIIELVAKVTKAGKSSITVTVELYSEDLLSGECNLATKGNFVMVAIDENGKSITIN